MKDADLMQASGAGGGADVGFFVRGRYKFWLLAAIVLLAFWSMFTGTVSLKWSAGSLTRVADDIDVPNYDDLDVLEMEDREKVVRHMWDVYTHSQQNHLPRFWQVAFDAAYEELASGDHAVREAAVSEIAKMSFRVIDLEPPRSQNSKIIGERIKEDTARAKKKSSAVK